MTIASGISFGVRSGLRTGLNPLLSVSRDAASNVYAPASSSEWTNALAAAGITSGTPSALWLAQEGSGNLATSIGVTAQALVPSVTSGTMLYQQAITGWSRKAVTFSDGGVLSLRNNLQVGINMATTSAIALVYAVRTGALGGTPRLLAGMGGDLYAEILTAFMNSSNQLAIGTSTTPSDTGSATYASGSVFPLILQHDRTNGVQRVITNSEVITKSAFAALTNENGQLFFGTLGGGVNAAPIGHAYAALWTGASAELTTAQIRTLLQCLGWTVTW